MSTSTSTPITIAATIARPTGQVWDYYTGPAHITQWNAATDDWHCPRAENDLRPGGRFTSRMEARDGSFGFDFGGTYSAVEPKQHFAYAMDDGRQVAVRFAPDGAGTRVTVTFDPESENPLEMQRQGWQAILDRFKAYVEKQA